MLPSSPAVAFGIDDLLAAIEAADRALADNSARNDVVRQRLSSLRSDLEAGLPLAAIVEAEASPRTVELITENATALDTSGAEFRGQLARGLRNEQLTIESIAELFGVTRQRVSALLRQVNG